MNIKNLQKELKNNNFPMNNKKIYNRIVIKELTNNFNSIVKKIFIQNKNSF